MIARWLFWVAWEWSLIAAALAVAWYWPVLIPLCILVIGSRQHALIVMAHEVVHCTPGRYRWLDGAANVLCMWWAGSDIHAYRHAHIKHHQRIGKPSDPEVIVRAKSPWSWSNLTRGKKALLLLMDCLGLTIRESIEVTRPVVGRYSPARIAYVAAIVVAAFASGLWPLLLLWLVTIVTALPAFARARSWREHYGLPAGQTYRYVARWWERVLYLPHYVWRHADHHSPGRWNVPCWRLRDI
jgi:fatty acid desaturase